MKTAQRKRLRLPDYDYSTPGAYFVTVCTKNRQSILSDITVGAAALGGPDLHLTGIGIIVEKYILSMTRIQGLRVEKFVIMPNHVHMLLIVDPDDGPPRAAAPTRATLPDAVRVWKRLIDRDVGRTVFQRSYHEHVIRNEKDYLDIWTYIDQNPAKWVEDRYYTAE